MELQRADGRGAAENLAPLRRGKLHVGALKFERIGAIGTLQRAAVRQLGREARRSAGERRVGRGESGARRRGESVRPFAQQTLVRKVLKNGDNVAQDEIGRRVVARGEIGGYFGHGSGPVDHQQHGQGGRVRLMRALRRQHDKAAARAILVEAGVTRESGLRAGLDHVTCVCDGLRHGAPTKSVRLLVAPPRVMAGAGLSMTKPGRNRKPAATKKPARVGKRRAGPRRGSHRRDVRRRVAPTRRRT